MLIRGVDVAGVVEAVGADVTEFKPGEGCSDIVRGPSPSTSAASRRNSCVKPASLTFEEAAGIPVAGMTALRALRDKGEIKAGQKVLITGASGGVGSFAVQIAKAMGAEVTAVCSTPNVELVRSLGADHVINYGEDFTRSGKRYDLIVYACGIPGSPQSGAHSRREGTFVGVGSSKPGNLVSILLSFVKPPILTRLTRQRFVGFMTRGTKENLEFLAKLIEEGKVRPIVDRTYPLAEAPAAVAYQEKGHAREGDSHRLRLFR